jgi:hypothetical protein
MNLQGHLNSLDGRSARRRASAYTGQHNTEKRRRTFMPQAGLEPAIPVFERSKTVRAQTARPLGPAQ